MSTRVPLHRGFAVAIALAAAAALLRVTPADAALGAPHASIAGDQATLAASIKATAHGAYTVHELTLPSGTLVREYDTAAGTVFAVAWNGPAKPNLSQLLGNYFADFVAAAKSSPGPGGRNHLNLSRSDLVIQAGGHMRAYFGRAYLVGAIPAGVSRDELR
jgi:hypothetical protein